MNAAIRDFARKLSITDAQLGRLERKYRYDHGAEAEAKLTRYLTKTWTECKDRPYIPARQNGIVHPPQYVADPAGGLPDEPESPDPDWLDGRAAEGWVVFDMVQAETQAQRRERTLGKQVRQAVAEARKDGRDVSPHVERIQAELDAMRRKAA